jgi:ribosomal protein S4E
MNLDDGRNIITKEKFSVGDSILLNTKESKIINILPLKKGSNIEVILGKHAGEKGKLIGHENLARGKNYLIKLAKGEVGLPLNALLVIE